MQGLNNRGSFLATAKIVIVTSMAIFLGISILLNVYLYKHSFIGMASNAQTQLEALPLEAKHGKAS